MVVYLKELEFDAKNVGLMFTLTLLGDAVISILMTSNADKWGRRNTLILSAIISIFTGITFATQTNFWVLLIASTIGVISPSGNEIGPFMAIELSGMSLAVSHTLIRLGSTSFHAYIVTSIDRSYLSRSKKSMHLITTQHSELSIVSSSIGFDYP